MRDRRNVLRRGDIVWVDLGNHPGSHVQSGRRPCIVVNTDKSNGGVYTVIPGSCKLEKRDFPVHIVVSPKEVKCGLFRETVFMAEQLTTVDNNQIVVKVGSISNYSQVLENLNTIISRQLDLGV